MRLYIAVALMGAGLFTGCVDYTSDLCIPHVDTFCYQGQSYWLDSCDRLENVFEECECGCRADQYGCRTCGEKECETDADCPEGFFCDRTDWLCKLKNCVPECDGKCCGPDGCGGDCPGSCPRGQECNPITCECETHCYTDADCAPNQCCFQGQCTVMTCGTLECGPDPTCGKECGPCPAGYNCANGACQGSGQLCPLGQECVDIMGTGYLACIIPPATIPPDNPTGCAAQGYCDGNFGCHCLDDACSESTCIENCGTCPAGGECCELWPDGLWGCLTPGCTDLPPNPPYCDQNTPCPGNAICYTDGTNNFCIDNCSSYGDNCTDGELRCQGNTIQVCQNGAWMNAIDCASAGQVCVDDNCVDPSGLGEFCETIPCAAGLDCLSTPDSQHSFCTPQCNCTQSTGCDAGWECLFSSNATPPTCWCGVGCNTASDCPGGGADWECTYLGQDEQGQNIYGCLPE